MLLSVGGTVRQQIVFMPQSSWFGDTELQLLPVKSFSCSDSVFGFVFSEFSSLILTCQLVDFQVVFLPCAWCPRGRICSDPDQSKMTTEDEWMNCFCKLSSLYCRHTVPLFLYHVFSVDSMVAQWAAWVTVYVEFYMFFPCLCGFPLGSLGFLPSSRRGIWLN